jgi:hypothetical protein
MKVATIGSNLSIQPYRCTEELGAEIMASVLSPLDAATCMSMSINMKRYS